MPYALCLMPYALFLMPMRGVAQTMVLETSTLFDDDNGTSLTTLDALSHMQQVRSAYVSSPHTYAARPAQHMSAARIRMRQHTSAARIRMRHDPHLLQVWVLPCSWCGFRV
jgi:hypothetical protein